MRTVFPFCYGNPLLVNRFQGMPLKPRPYNFITIPVLLVCQKEYVQKVLFLTLEGC